MAKTPTGSTSFAVEAVPPFSSPMHGPVGPVPPVWNLQNQQRIGLMGAPRRRKVLGGITGGLLWSISRFTKHPSASPGTHRFSTTTGDTSMPPSDAKRPALRTEPAGRDSDSTLHTDPTGLQAGALFFLRASIALLVLVWGLDKIVDPGHAMAVSDRFYFGLLSHPALLPMVGAAQVGVALLGLVGLFRRFIDPVILLINLGSLLSVWRSIVDPWGWVFEGTNALFFPSLIVLAGCILLLAFRDYETLTLDVRLGRRGG